MNRFEADVRSHEWVFIESKDDSGKRVVLQRCMHCRVSRRGYRNQGSSYRMPGGEKTTKCPPCPSPPSDRQLPCDKETK